MPVMNVRDKKNQLRAKHKKLRLSCPEEMKTSLDTKLCQNFLSLDDYRKCDVLFAFVSTKIEVNTDMILRQALADGKKLAVPKCRKKEPVMDFYFITDMSQLEKGAFSIMEPNPEKCEKVTDFSQGLCLVPGLCFDLEGYRIGFGKGYYDRFLQMFKGITVGICYNRCTEQKIPTGIYDKSVDILVTEKFTNDTRKVFGKGMV